MHRKLVVWWEWTTPKIKGAVEIILFRDNTHNLS